MGLLDDMIYLHTDLSVSPRLYRRAHHLTKQYNPAHDDPARQKKVSRRGLFGIFGKKKSEADEEDIMVLEQLLKLNHKTVVRNNRRRFMIRAFKDVTGYTMLATLLVGGLGGMISMCGNEYKNPRPNRDLKDYKGLTNPQGISDQCRKVAEEQDVPQHILEGMVLACSDKNPYSLHQRQNGLGGVVLTDPYANGVAQHTLDRDPLLSLSFAAKRYKGIRRNAKDDEMALAIFFSSENEVEKAMKSSQYCFKQEFRRADHLSPANREYMKSRKIHLQNQIAFEQENGRMTEEEAERFRQENMHVLQYPWDGMDFIRDHEKNSRCIYYVNNLNDFAREAVKLALYKHPEYRKQYWSKKDE